MPTRLTDALQVDMEPDEPFADLWARPNWLAPSPAGAAPARADRRFWASLRCRYRPAARAPRRRHISRIPTATGAASYRWSTTARRAIGRRPPRTESA